MPELPDLTVFVENLDRAVAGKKIRDVSGQEKNFSVPRSELQQALAGKEIVRLERSGKEVCIRFNDGGFLQIHLMLNGGFVLNQLPPSSILTITFADGGSLSVTDPKGWAKVALNAQEPVTGIDALEISADDLKRLFAKKPRMLAKAFLIDQQLIRGIGNAYADEILWEARIAPQSVVGKMPPEAVARLAKAIPKVLRRATEQIRKSHPGIVAGEVRDFLIVHNPSRKESPFGGRIKKEQISGKTTYYTDEQNIYR